MGSTKRMALNAVIMYLKMFISIIVSLYTSRIILDVLGVVDYGIYNVVGGVVTMLVFLNASMSSATQRFITIEIGKKANANVKKVFSASIFSHAVLGILIFIIIEIIGLYFFKKFINVPVDRYQTAIIVFHFSAISLVVNLLIVPFRALINAYENMIIIAIIDTVNIFLRLAAVLYLLISPYDKLIVYGFNILAITIITLLTYGIVCKIKYKESNIIKVSDMSFYKQFLSFGGFNLIGNLAVIGRNQGFAILINIFFGTVLNAAFGIASQVSAHLRSFTINILTAVNPQLTKRFASNDTNEMFKLMFVTSKIVFFVQFIIAIPFLFEPQFVLQLWLKDVPTNAPFIVSIITGIILLEMITHPIYTIIMAKGKIKFYQIIVGSILLLNIPISFLFLHLGFNFNVIFYVSAFLSFVNVVANIVFATKLVGLNLLNYINKVMIPIGLVTLVSISLILSLYQIIDSESFHSFLLRMFLSVSVIIISIIIFGINRHEKNILKKEMSNLVLRKRIG